MALISHDQFTYSDTDRLRSLAYWTLIGVHLVNAEENQTRTLMDVVVYDIRRGRCSSAQGGEKRGRRPGAAPSASRRNGARRPRLGFSRAVDGLITNLRTSFAFSKPGARADVRDSAPAVRIIRTQEAQGFVPWRRGRVGSLTLIAATLGAAAWRRARSREKHSMPPRRGRVRRAVAA